MKSCINILVLFFFCFFVNSITAKEDFIKGLNPAVLEGDTTIMQQTGVQILTDCAGVILDPGGYENYQNLISSVITIQPPSPSFVSLFFPEFDIENAFDDFYIHDGPDQNSPLIGSYDGMDLFEQTIVSSGGALTIVFQTDGSVVREGFVINYSVAGGSDTPVANFEVSQTTPIPLNFPVSFTDLSQNAGSWLYDFGDGMQSTEQNPVHSFSTPGTYNVSLTISNCSNTNTYTQTVVVQEPGELTINPDDICVTLNSFMTTTVQVSLTNTGVGDLYYNFTEISDENPNSLTVILGTGVIPSGGTQNVNLFFSAGDLLGGTYNFDLLLETGDINQPELIYPVKMIVVGIPLISVSPNIIDFSLGYLDNPQVDSLCITNFGTDTLQVTGIDIDNPGFSISPTELSVPPGGTAKTYVTLLAEEVGIFVSIASIFTNAGTTVTIPILGEVIDPPVGVFNPDDICINLSQDESTLLIMGISNEGGEVLNWNFGFPNTIPDWLEISSLNGALEPDENGNVPIIIDATGLNSGTYEYTATIFTNDPILGEAYLNVKLNVLAPPIADFFPSSQNTCDGTISFTNTSIGEATSWLWDFGDNTTSDTQNPTHVYEEIGVYTVSLISCNPAGCDTIQYEDLINYTTEEEDCGSFTLGIVGDTTLYSCSGYIYDSGGPNGDYAENSNYTLTIAPPDATAIYISFDEFELEQGNWDFLNVYAGEDNSSPLLGTYSGTEAPGGGDLLVLWESLTLEFISDGFIQRPGFGMSYSCIRPEAVALFTSNIDNTCSNEVIFTNNSLYAEEYAWDFGDGNFSDEYAPTHVYDAPGNYQVVLTAENEAGISIFTETIQIEALPFDLTISPPDNVYLNMPAAFSYNASVNINQFEWSTSSGNTANLDNPNFIFYQLGGEEITLVGTDINGCQVTTSETIFVDELSNISDNQLISSFKVYPNPTQGQVNIDLDLKENSQIELILFNALGQKLFTKNSQSTASMNEVLNLNDFPTGTYSLSISLDGEFAGRRRLILL